MRQKDIEFPDRVRDRLPHPIAHAVVRVQKSRNEPAECKTQIQAALEIVLRTLCGFLLAEVNMADPAVCSKLEGNLRRWKRPTIGDRFGLFKDLVRTQPVFLREAKSWYEGKTPDGENVEKRIRDLIEWRNSEAHRKQESNTERDERIAAERRDEFFDLVESLKWLTDYWLLYVQDVTPKANGTQWAIFQYFGGTDPDPIPTGNLEFRGFLGERHVYLWSHQRSEALSLEPFLQKGDFGGSEELGIVDTISIGASIVLRPPVQRGDRCEKKVPFADANLPQEKIVRVVIPSESQTQISYDLVPKLQEFRQRSESSRTHHPVVETIARPKNHTGAVIAATFLLAVLGLVFILVWMPGARAWLARAGILPAEFAPQDHETTEPAWVLPEQNAGMESMVLGGGRPQHSVIEDGSRRIGSQGSAGIHAGSAPSARVEADSAVEKGSLGPPPIRRPVLPDGRWKLTSLVLGDCDLDQDWSGVRGSYDLTVLRGEPTSLLRTGDYNPRRRGNDFRTYDWTTRGIGHRSPVSYLGSIDVEFVTTAGTGLSYRFVYLQPRGSELGTVGVWYQLGEPSRQHCLWGSFGLDPWDGGFPSMTDPPHNTCLRDCAVAGQPSLEDLDRFGYDNADPTAWSKCARRCFSLDQG